MERAAVIAVGGNALILEGQRGTIAEQFENARVAAGQIADLVAAGWRVVVTHGNAPQVGFILRRTELVAEADAPKLSLEMAVADSEGEVGYIVDHSLVNELGRRGRPDQVVCLLTQTVVDPADPAFAHPTKPIGARYDAAQAEALRSAQGWRMVEDAGRGYRRVVASPRPLRIVESGAIETLLAAGFVVVACGGGGIPVVERAPGVYQGVDAVVDKDLASALLATSLGVPLLVMATSVERVAVHYRRPDQRWLDRLTAAQARAYLAAGEFPPGNMGPKIEAALQFLAAGGRRVVITSELRLADGLAGRTGTEIVPD